MDVVGVVTMIMSLLAMALAVWGVAMLCARQLRPKVELRGFRHDNIGTLRVELQFNDTPLDEAMEIVRKLKEVCDAGQNAGEAPEPITVMPLSRVPGGTMGVL